MVYYLQGNRKFYGCVYQNPKTKIKYIHINPILQTTTRLIGVRSFIKNIRFTEFVQIIGNIFFFPPSVTLTLSLYLSRVIWDVREDFCVLNTFLELMLILIWKIFYQWKNFNGFVTEDILYLNFGWGRIEKAFELNDVRDIMRINFFLTRLFKADIKSITFKILFVYLYIFGIIIDRRLNLEQVFIEWIEKFNLMEEKDFFVIFWYWYRFKWFWKLMI